MTDLGDTVAAKLGGNKGDSDRLREMWSALDEAYSEEGENGVSEEIVKRWGAKHEQLQQAIDKLRDLF